MSQKGPHLRMGIKLRRSREEKIERVTIGLAIVRDRMERRVKEMTNRSRQLFEQVVAAKMEGDEERAAILASELHQLRSMLNVAIRNQLMIEAVVNKLETIRDIDEFRKFIGPIRSLVSSVAPSIRGVAPEIGHQLQTVQEQLEDLSFEIGTVPNLYLPPIEPDEEEVRKILKEAAEVAARRLRESTPEPP
jgi:division protein CdvB (Snf7/Vps24/ESCRT-III family)